MTEPATPDTLSSATSGAAPFRKLILTGALLGLVPAAGLSIFRAVAEGGLVPGAGLSAFRVLFEWESLPGDIVFALIYGSPYLIALYASRMGRAAAQAPLLLAATLVSFLASFSALSGVSLLLLPATVVLGIATVRAFHASNMRLVRKITLSTEALISSVVVVLAFLALYSNEDARCWEFREYSDGRVVREAMEVPASGFGGRISLPPTPDNVVSLRAECTSDVVTPIEALIGLGLLATGLLVLAATARYSGSTTLEGAP